MKKPEKKKLSRFTRLKVKARAIKKHDTGSNRAERRRLIELEAFIERMNLNKYFNPESLRKALLELADADPDVRKKRAEQMVELVRDFGHDIILQDVAHGTPVYIKALKDPYPLRQDMMYILGELKEKRAVKPLIEIIGSKMISEQDVIHAASALGKISRHFLEGDKDAEAKFSLLEERLPGRGNAWQAGNKGLILYAVATQPKMRKLLPSSMSDRRQAGKRAYLKSLVEGSKGREIYETLEILGLFKKKGKK